MVRADWLKTDGASQARFLHLPERYDRTAGKALVLPEESWFLIGTGRAEGSAERDGGPMTRAPQW
jgi:hypothetical protein